MGPKKPKAAPPNQLKSVTVDWKTQRKKLESVKEKTKGIKTMFVSFAKKTKTSVVASQTADPSKPPPKKMNLSFVGLIKSASAPDSDDSASASSVKPLLPPPPPPNAMTASRSFDEKQQKKTKSAQSNHVRRASAGYQKKKSNDAFK